MEFNAHQSFPVVDRSYFHFIKREIQKLADKWGFNENKRGKIDIILSELTSNLIKHTTHGGEILVKPVGKEKITGIEILAVDNGPGMMQVERMIEDGVSTIGSQGEGLGAIKRLSDEFDLYSLYNHGTVILSRLYITNKDQKRSTLADSLDIRAVMVAKSGETSCGDAWAAMPDNENYVIIAIDGLGHGIDAHEAAVEAVLAFTGNMSVDPALALKIIHQEIKKTRGAVGAIAVINTKNNNLTFCGIGNIAGKVLSLETGKSLISYNGILGHNIPNTINNHNFSWSDSSMIVMHSDGLKSRWDVSKYPQIRKHDASVIAAFLYKEHTRKTDDVLVIVGKKNK
jgi:anti-sigma regulatory factor (Ser/Thr protein kinase)